jgi:hypothetical protein
MKNVWPKPEVAVASRAKSASWGCSAINVGGFIMGSWHRCGALQGFSQRFYLRAVTG